MAATLYFMLTGDSPEDAGKRNNESLIYKIDPLKIPNEINPTISFEVTQGIMKGLAWSTKYRSQTIQDWIDLLLELNSQKSVKNNPPSPQNPLISPAIPAQFQRIVKQTSPNQPSIIEHTKVQVQQEPAGSLVPQDKIKPIKKKMKKRFGVKLISLGILGLLSLTGGGFY